MTFLCFFERVHLFGFMVPDQRVCFFFVNAKLQRVFSGINGIAAIDSDGSFSREVCAVGDGEDGVTLFVMFVNQTGTGYVEYGERHLGDVGSHGQRVHVPNFVLHLVDGHGIHASLHGDDIGAILAGAVERVHFSVERSEHHVADETVSVGGGRCGGVV